MVQKRLSIHGQSPLNRFFLSHLTLLFSIQSTFRERRLIILLKYFLQIYPPKNWWIQKSSTFAPAAQLHRGFHRTYSSFCRWLVAGRSFQSDYHNFWIIRFLIHRVLQPTFGRGAIPHRQGTLRAFEA